MWGELLTKTLISMGLTQSKSDTCVYFAKGILIGVYVDDLIICTKHDEDYHRIMAALKNQFSIKELGVISYILGLRITFKSGDLIIDQSK